MIIRHQQILHDYTDRRPLTPAGRFWIGYVAAVALIVLWVLA
jgi:hypothetical protein